MKEMERMHTTHEQENAPGFKATNDLIINSLLTDAKGGLKLMSLAIYLEILRNFIKDKLHFIWRLNPEGMGDVCCRPQLCGTIMSPIPSYQCDHHILLPNCFLLVVDNAPSHLKTMKDVSE